MNSEITKKEQLEVSSSNKVYGSKLKSARVSLQKSIKEIAVELNLKPSIVEAIEEMEENKLPSAAYVKGYLRSYAKLVHIDSGVLIDDYGSDKEDNVLQRSYHVQLKDVNNNEPNILIIVAVVTFIALLFAILSWQSNKSKNNNISPQTKLETSLSSESDRSESDREENENLDINTKSSENDTLGNSNKDKSISEAEDSSVTLSQEEKLSSVGLLEENRSLKDKQIINTDGEESNTEVITANPEIIKSNPEVITPKIIQVTQGDSPLLNVTATGDSWIEIKNKDNERIYANIIHYGDTRLFSADSSYKITLGVSSVVKIRFAEKDIDFSPYVKSNGTAYFMLSEDEVPSITNKLQQ